MVRRVSLSQPAAGHSFLAFPLKFTTPPPVYKVTSFASLLFFRLLATCERV